MTPVLVIDLEATCDDADGLPASDMEIIEIGAVWATAEGSVLDTFQALVRPVVGVVCGRGRNPTLRLWPAIFSGEIDVFPSERRNMGQEIGR